MKNRSARVGMILLLALTLVMSMVTFASATTTLKVDSTSPKDGATGQPLENMGVKVTFNEEVYNPDFEAINSEACQLYDADGKEVPTRVVFSADEPYIALILADLDGNARIAPDAEYSLVISGDFTGAEGEKLANEYSLTFKTQNPKTTMWISTGMMVAMMALMILFGMREAKKSREEETKGKKEAPVNPYKVAKEKGKSVEEVVAEDKKRKEKEAAKAARKAKHAAENKVDINDGNVRVSRPRPISEAGSTYKAPTK